MGFIKNIVGGITGSTAANASRDAAEIQSNAGQQAIEQIRTSTAEGQAFLQPFQQIGEEGLDKSSFLTSPDEQFDFLQNNPLFQLGLDNANTVTQKSAAASGRLSSGDTLEQLTNNSLLTAAPLIAGQKNTIQNLLNQGLQTAQGQANTAIGQGTNIADTTTDIGAALAGGQVGAANARSSGAQNILSLGGQIAGSSIGKSIGSGIAGLFSSDPSLKENIELIGNKNGFNIYTWDWNELANDELGLAGSSEGVMADEVKDIMPEAVEYKDGFMHVDYNMIGVQ
jgi:hypothetical protein